MSSAEVVGVGAPIVDYIIEIDEKYLEEIGGLKSGMMLIDLKTLQKILRDCSADPSIIIPGGSAANTIRGLAHLGRRCAFIGKIGIDLPGQKFTEVLKSLGIGTDYLLKSEIPTAQVLCLVTPDKERTMRAFPGASSDLREADIQAAMFEGVKLAHFEGYNLLNYPVLEKALKLAKAAGTTISMDLGSFELVEAHRDIVVDLITNYVDIVFANRQEAWSLTKLPPQKACALLRDICQTVVVFAGKEGCYVGQQSQVIYHPAFVVEEPIDTIGAGDLFASGFLKGYLENLPITECARIGSLAGAAAVRVKGVDVSPEMWQKISSKEWVEEEKTP